MNLRLRDIFCCPIDKGNLDFHPFSETLGLYVCKICRRWYPIINNISCFMPDELRGEQDGRFLYQIKNLTIPNDIKSILERKRERFAKPTFSILEMERWDYEKDRFEDTIPEWRNITEIDNYLRFLNPQPLDIVLELGCGTGRVTRKYCFSVKYIVGVDFSFDSLNILVDSYRYDNLLTVQADIRYLPFKDEVFSKVISASVLMCVPKYERRETLAEVFRVLRPDGKFIISVLNYTLPERIKNILPFIKKDKFMCKKEGFLIVEQERHIYYYHFDKSELLYILGEYFTVHYLRGIVNRFPFISHRLYDKGVGFDRIIQKIPLMSFFFGLLLIAVATKKKKE